MDIGSLLNTKKKEKDELMEDETFKIISNSPTKKTTIVPPISISMMNHGPTGSMSPNRDGYMTMSSPRNSLKKVKVCSEGGDGSLSPSSYISPPLSSESAQAHNPHHIMSPNSYSSPSIVSPHHHHHPHHIQQQQHFNHHSNSPRVHHPHQYQGYHHQQQPMSPHHQYQPHPHHIQQQQEYYHQQQYQQSTRSAPSSPPYHPKQYTFTQYTPPIQSRGAQPHHQQVLHHHQQQGGSNHSNHNSQPSSFIMPPLHLNSNPNIHQHSMVSSSPSSPHPENQQRTGTSSPSSQPSQSTKQQPIVTNSQNNQDDSSPPHSPSTPNGPSPRSDSTKSKGEKKSRVRLKKDQSTILKNFFDRDNYPNKEEKDTLANQLNMTYTAVSTWFSNKRQDNRRKSTDQQRRQSVSSPSPPSISLSAGTTPSLSSTSTLTPTLQSLSVHNNRLDPIQLGGGSLPASPRRSGLVSGLTSSSGLSALSQAAHTSNIDIVASVAAALSSSSDTPSSSPRKVGISNLPVSIVQPTTRSFSNQNSNLVISDDSEDEDTRSEEGVGSEMNGAITSGESDLEDQDQFDDSDVDDEEDDKNKMSLLILGSLASKKHQFGSKRKATEYPTQPVLPPRFSSPSSSSTNNNNNNHNNINKHQEFLSNELNRLRQKYPLQK